MQDKRNDVSLQELAEFLRNATYSDGLTHELTWSLYVLHPRNNDGVVEFGGGIFCKHNAKRPENIRQAVSISIAYNELNGITNFKLWRNGNEVRGFPFREPPSFEQFKQVVVSEFKIAELYAPREKE